MSIRGVASSLVGATAVLGGVSGLAGAGTSYHGQDFSFNYGYEEFWTCDDEADGNDTGGRIRVSDLSGPDEYSINDVDGPGPTPCAGRTTHNLLTAHESVGHSHRTGEKNVVWSFGNWVPVTAEK